MGSPEGPGGSRAPAGLGRLCSDVFWPVPHSRLDLWGGWHLPKFYLTFISGAGEEYFT